MIIHSIFSHFEDGPPPKIVVRHVTHRKGLMTVERGEYDLAILRKLTAAIFAANERLVPILMAACEMQDADRFAKSSIARSNGWRELCSHSAIVFEAKIAASLDRPQGNALPQSVTSGSFSCAIGA